MNNSQQFAKENSVKKLRKLVTQPFTSNIKGDTGITKITETRDELSITLYLQSEINVF